MERVVFCILLLVAVDRVVAQAEVDKPYIQGGTVLEQEPLIRVGLLKGQAPTLIWEFENPFDFELEFVGASASCSCSSIKATDRRIPGGGTGDLLIELAEGRSTSFEIACAYQRSGSSDEKFVARQRFSVEVRDVVEWTSKEWRVVEKGRKGAFVARVRDRSRFSWSSGRLELDDNSLDSTVTVEDRGSFTEFSIFVFPQQEFDWNRQRFSVEAKLLGVSEEAPSVSKIVSTATVQVLPFRRVSVVPSVLFCDPNSDDQATLLILCRDRGNIAKYEFKNAASLAVKENHKSPGILKLSFSQRELSQLIGDRDVVELWVEASEESIEIKIPVFREGL